MRSDLVVAELEARVGIEPTHKAFAEPCLTTWLPRRYATEEKHKGGAQWRKPNFAKQPNFPGRVFGTTRNGVQGLSSDGNGVQGSTACATANGVYGENTGGGFGVAGRTTGNGSAIYGDNTSASGWAVLDKITACQSANGTTRKTKRGGMLDRWRRIRAVFNLGSDDTSIATMDADGVALAAIHGLNQSTTRKRRAFRHWNAPLPN